MNGFRQDSLRGRPPVAAPRAGAGARMLAAALVAAALVACQAPGAGGPAAPIGSATATRSQVPPAIAARLRQIGPVVNPPETAKLYAGMQAREPYVGVRVLRDIRYGPNARHRLDLFVPTAGAGVRPVLVFVHGGAFIRGDKRTGTSPFYDNVMLWAVNHGMIGVNMTYRLAPANSWPAAQEDIRDALRWVREQIGQHGGDPARVFLSGHSAGAAHVAQYLGHDRFHVAPGGGVAGAVLLSGIFDTATAEPNPPLKAYFGADPARYAERSALPGLLRVPARLFVAYAELDPADFHRQAEQLRDALCRAGRCPTFVKLAEHSHMSEIYAINTADEVLTDAMQAFLSSP